jgi:hypothetical protein
MGAGAAGAGAAVPPPALPLALGATLGTPAVPQRGTGVVAAAADSVPVQAVRRRRFVPPSAASGGAGGVAGAAGLVPGSATAATALAFGAFTPSPIASDLDATMPVAPMRLSDGGRESWHSASSLPIPLTGVRSDPSAASASADWLQRQTILPSWSSGPGSGRGGGDVLSSSVAASPPSDMDTGVDDAATTPGAGANGDASGGGDRDGAADAERAFDTSASSASSFPHSFSQASGFLLSGSSRLGFGSAFSNAFLTPGAGASPPVYTRRSWGGDGGGAMHTQQDLAAVTPPAIPVDASGLSEASAEDRCSPAVPQPPSAHRVGGIGEVSAIGGRSGMLESARFAYSLDRSFPQEPSERSDVSGSSDMDME